METTYSVREILSIKPHYSTVTAKLSCDSCGSLPHRYYCSHRRNSNLIPEENRSKGNVSQKAKIRIQTYMNWMMLFSNKKFVWDRKKKKGYYFKINFITLTLSQKQKDSDEFIKEHLLQPFLKWMRRSHNVINYIWKTEAQKNGNIHFHITTNKFIHWRSIRNKWNSLQKNHNYLQDYFQQNGTHDPNSTDVHSVINEKEIIGYMAKYVTKNQKDRRQITGKIWDCNTELKKLKMYIDSNSENYHNTKNEFITTNADRIKETEHCKIIFHNITEDTQLPLVIADKFTELHKIFSTGDDGVRKYSVN